MSEGTREWNNGWITNYIAGWTTEFVDGSSNQSIDRSTERASEPVSSDHPPYPHPCRLFPLQDKHISRSNVGFQLLMKMGWQQGKPLGKSGVGIVEPIKTEMRDVRMGLGKPEEDEYWICAENVKRK